MPPLFWFKKKKETTEGRKAGRASKPKPPPPHPRLAKGLDPPQITRHPRVLMWGFSVSGANGLPATQFKPLKFFPKIHMLLPILSALPITSVECERLFSALRLRKTHLRAAMAMQQARVSLDLR